MNEVIKISTSTKQKVDKMASEAGVSSDELADALLSSFIDNDGKVYVGNWREGPGLRLLPDWPRFSSGVIKIKKEEIK